MKEDITILQQELKEEYGVEVDPQDLQDIVDHIADFLADLVAPEDHGV